MVRLNRFIINSDYDSLKIFDHEEWTINISATTLNSSDILNYTYVFDIPEDVYFESFSASHSDFPNYYATGASRIYFSIPHDSGQTSIDYTIIVIRTSPTQYTVKVTMSRSQKPSAPATTSVAASQIKIKLNLLVPSEQQ